MLLHHGIAILEHDTHLSQWVIEHNRLDFDQNVLPFVLPYIKEGDSVIDVGANIGCYAYAFLKKVGDKGKVYCFEPSNESFECLLHNLVTFPNAILSYKALSNKKSTYTVLRHNDNVGMNFCEEVKGGEVYSITIDSMNLTKCDFIKLDCEGMELDVLLGGQETISKFNPTMFIEINEHTLKRKGITPKHIFDFLDANNYIYHNVYPHVDMEGEQYDIIAKHKSK
jgi:FkbM family methyltransferase